MADVSEILQNALSLSAEERAAVAEKLLASLDDLDEAEAARLWAEEASRRWAQYQAGHTQTVESADVAGKAQRLFR